MYELYIGGVLFPVTPAKISTKINNKNKTVNLISEGEVNIPKTAGLTEITISELLLPVQKYPFAQPGTLPRPAVYLEKLERWKRKKKHVEFKLLRYELSSDSLLWDTTMDVTIEDYEIMEDAEKYGMDIAVKLNLKEYRAWGAKELVIKKGKTKKTAKKKTTRKQTKEISRSYKVKKGDTLIKIARQQLGDGSQYTKIYELNRKTIEDAARKHGRKSSSNGWWIYPDTVLKLPGGNV